MATAESRSACRKGFTLIELLVVIAIIGILLAFLTPAVQHLVTVADRVACASNLRQYANAMHAYIPDNNGIFPSCHSLGPVDVEHTWIGALYPYASSQELAHCPALQGPRPDHGVTWEWTWSGRHLGYGYNMWFLGGSHDPNRQNSWYMGIHMDRDVPLTDVLQPAMCIMFGDSNPKVVNGVDYGCTISLYWPYVNCFHEGVNDTRHDNAGNVGFVDGHVVTIPDPDKNINPPYDGAPHFIENWDRRQRRNLWPD